MLRASLRLIVPPALLIGFAIDPANAQLRAWDMAAGTRDARPGSAVFTLMPSVAGPALKSALEAGVL